MELFRHLLIFMIIGVALRWLWTSSLTERANFAAGRTIFPPTRAIRILRVVCGIAFASLFLWSWFDARKPDERWVPYLFLGFLVMDVFMCPAALSIEVDGIGSRYWWAREEKKIRWEEVASLHYNTGNKQFTVRANNGRKITHGGFNADQAQFVHDIRERTRLPMKVTQPGTWKCETIEVPYEDQIEAGEEQEQFEAEG
jgi:hypothetical protein